MWTTTPLNAPSSSGALWFLKKVLKLFKPSPNSLVGKSKHKALPRVVGWQEWSPPPLEGPLGGLRALGWGMVWGQDTPSPITYPQRHDFICYQEEEQMEIRNDV